MPTPMRTRPSKSENTPTGAILVAGHGGLHALLRHDPEVQVLLATDAAVFPKANIRRAQLGIGAVRAAGSTFGDQLSTCKWLN